MPAGATILHADLDAFYASVEQLLDPSLRGRADRGRRWGGAGGVVRGQAVRRAGRHVGVAGEAAVPRPHVRRGHFREYQRLADQVMDVLGDFTPLVQRISIDEAFLDVSGSVHLFGPPEVIGATDPQPGAHRDRPARSRSARPAPSTWPRSRRRWPSPTAWWSCDPADEREFLDPLPVGLMWGVGPVTQAAAGRTRHPHHRAAGRVTRRRAAVAARPRPRRQGGRARRQRRSTSRAAPGARRVGRRAVGVRPARRRRPN